MKLYKLSALAVAGTIAFLLTQPLRSHSEAKTIHAAVLISAKETYRYVTYVDNYGNTNRYAQSDGMAVEYVSPSANLPAVEAGTALGEAIAFYRGQGLMLQPQPVYGLYLMSN